MHKLSLSLIVVVLTAIAGLGWGLDQLFHNYFNNSKENSDLHAYESLGSSLAKTLDRIEDSQYFIRQWQHNEKLTIDINNIDAFPLPPEITPSFMQGKPITLASEDSLSLHFYMPNKQQVLSITLLYQQTDNNHTTLSLIFTLFFYSGILILVLLWLYPLMQRLSILRKTAQAFGEGDLNQRVSKSSVSYISDIEDEFNKMAQRIQTLVSDNKLLGNAVSHDLRTPLARLRFGIDALSETNDPEIRQKYQQHISHDIEEMESLVEILLSYARMEQSLIDIQKHAQDLNSLISDCLSALHNNDKDIQYQTRSSACVIAGDARYLQILINNLLQNAVQYAAQKVQIVLWQDDNSVYVSIDDDGPGIATELGKDAFKPFIRGKHSNDHKGFGMGLAIALRVVEWHDGSISTARSETLNGASMRLRFPRQQQP